MTELIGETELGKIQTTWPRSHFKSQVNALFVLQLIKAYNKENIIGPFQGESYRWLEFPLQMASNVESISWLGNAFHITGHL